MALTQVTNELIATGGVHTNNIADDSVTHAKVGTEFTTSSVLTAAAAIDINFNSSQVFTLTPDQNTTLNITNPVVGISKVIVITGAGATNTISYTVGGVAGTFNLIAGEYDDTAALKNFIQLMCVSPTEFWYSISQIAV
tara:strand:- start:217 stop:633 length:417 start_codon:yes stop_codon:yes gene_type:complete